jgi:hypothetical protein
MDMLSWLKKHWRALASGVCAAATPLLVDHPTALTIATAACVALGAVAVAAPKKTPDQAAADRRLLEQLDQLRKDAEGRARTGEER